MFKNKYIVIFRLSWALQCLKVKLGTHYYDILESSNKGDGVDQSIVRVSEWQKYSLFISLKYG